MNVLYNTTFIPVEDDTFRLGANWSELKEEIVKEIWSIKRYKNNKHYLQDNDVIDTTIRIYNIINKNFMKMS